MPREGGRSPRRPSSNPPLVPADICTRLHRDRTFLLKALGCALNARARFNITPISIYARNYSSLLSRRIQLRGCPQAACCRGGTLTLRFSLDSALSAICANMRSSPLVQLKQLSCYNYINIVGYYSDTYYTLYSSSAYGQTPRGKIHS